MPGVTSTWGAPFSKLQDLIKKLLNKFTGEVSERPKEHAWKVCVRLRVPRVRIPPSPPFQKTACAVFFHSGEEGIRVFNIGRLEPSCAQCAPLSAIKSSS